MLVAHTTHTHTHTPTHRESFHDLPYCTIITSAKNGGYILTLKICPVQNLTWHIKMEAHNLYLHHTSCLHFSSILACCPSFVQKVKHLHMAWSWGLNSRDSVNSNNSN